MGKKNQRATKKAWCYYCDRGEFDDEKSLVQHQKAKHFKCHLCHRKFCTANGMVIHVLRVHRENVTKVPNAKSGRDSTDIEIYGMQGIPADVLAAHYGEQEEEPPAKVSKVDIPSAPLAPAVPMPYMVVYQPQQVPGAVRSMCYPGPGWPMPPRPHQLYPQNTAISVPEQPLFPVVNTSISQTQALLFSAPLPVGGVQQPSPADTSAYPSNNSIPVGGSNSHLYASGPNSTGPFIAKVPRPYGMVYPPQQVPGAVRPRYYPAAPMPPRPQQWYPQSTAISAPQPAHLEYRPPQLRFPVQGMRMTMPVLSPIVQPSPVSGVAPPGMLSSSPATSVPPQHLFPVVNTSIPQTQASPFSAQQPSPADNAYPSNNSIPVGGSYSHSYASGPNTNGPSPVAQPSPVTSPGILSSSPAMLVPEQPLFPVVITSTPQTQASPFSAPLGPAVSRPYGMSSPPQQDITGLPNEILSLIVSTLPIRENVRTSLVTPRWKYLWKCLPRLDIKARDFASYNKFVECVNGFIREVSRDIDTFRIKGIGKEEASLRFWVEMVLMRSVRNLHIESFASFVIPRSLYTSRSLVSLVLYDARLEEFEEVNLPNLANLSLIGLDSTTCNKSIEKLIKGCLVIRDLKIYVENMPLLTEIVVTSKSLEKLEMCLHRRSGENDEEGQALFIDSPQLKVLRIRGNASRKIQIKSIGNDCKVFLRIESSKNVLDAFKDCGELSIGSRSLQEVNCVFKNMTKLQVVNFRGSQWGLLKKILQCSPSLKNLRLTRSGAGEMSVKISGSKRFLKELLGQS